MQLHGMKIFYDSYYWKSPICIHDLTADDIVRIGEPAGARQFLIHNESIKRVGILNIVSRKELQSVYVQILIIHAFDLHHKLTILAF
jgi:hypothetical protein